MVSSQSGAWVEPYTDSPSFLRPANLADSFSHQPPSGRPINPHIVLARDGNRILHRLTRIAHRIGGIDEPVNKRTDLAGPNQKSG